MNINDHVFFSGVVKDKVEVQATGQQNVLVGADLDGKEFWFPEQYTKAVPSPTELQAMADAAGFTLTPKPPAAPAHAGATPAHATAGTTAKH